MPQSLVYEFIDQLHAGTPLLKSLKRAIFQAKWDLGEEELERENGKEHFQIWKVKMRGLDDSDPVDWWFASTAIPILAATLGPLANVLSIGALITSWRVTLYDPSNPSDNPLPELKGVFIHDPTWCYWVNVASLIMGFIGNLFLLLNMQNRVRYIISLPLTIILWLLACGLLTGDLAGMYVHAHPTPEKEMFSEGYWYGIAASCAYLLLSLLLMGNLLGYIRGHYPQHFDLTGDQRTLIVQTMIFFVWLGGGAGVYSRIEGWQWVDGLYYCDVTILTIGFGDLVPTTNLARAFLFPYTTIGIITLGLVISSIYHSVQDLGRKHIRHRFEQECERTLSRTVTTSLELERREKELELARECAVARQVARGSVRSPATVGQVAITRLMWHLPQSNDTGSKFTSRRRGSIGTLGSTSVNRLSLAQTNTIRSFRRQRDAIILLKEEKQRFEAMRQIQERNELWKQWWRLGMSLSVFAAFWLVGAVIFYEAEMSTLGMTYWESVYFCWVAILSIGYGDFAPKSGSGRCAFVIWSLIAVPTVTILASDLTGTVVVLFNRWSHAVADVTVLPRYGVWRGLMEKHPRLFLNLPHWLRRRAEAQAGKERVRAGFPVGGVNESDVEKGMTPSTPESTPTTPPNERDREREQEHRNDAFAAGTISPNLADIAEQHDEDVANKRKIPDAAALARQLALAIRRAAHDLGGSEKDKKKYSYEEWVEFTRLIRFSAPGGMQQAVEEEEKEDEGLIEWDWIGEDSPMMARVCEPQFVLDRLVESLVRYLRRNPPVDRFAASLKDRGEDALTMKTSLGHHGQDREGEGNDREEMIVQLKRSISAPGLARMVKSGRRNMSMSSKRDGLSSTSRNRNDSPDGDTITPVAPALHPVEEEDY